MSRLPLTETQNAKTENVECYFVDSDVNSTVTCTEIMQATRVSRVLSKVF